MNKSCIINGIEWHPFGVEFKTEEGSFSFEIFAANAEHASYVLDELKKTAFVLGQISSQSIGESNDKCRQQVADLILTDKETGDDLFIVSGLRNTAGGFMSFDVQAYPQSQKFKIDIKITET